MTDIRMRPKFDLVTPCDPNTVLLRLETHLKNDNLAVHGKVFPSSAVLKVRPEDLTFWSPQLQVSLEPHLPSGSVVHVLIGPRPSIWSMFVASYTFWVFLGTMGVIFGFSQVSLGQPSTAMWAGPISVLAVGFTYLAARMGRKLGHDQSVLLKSTLDTVLQKCTSN